MTRKLCFTILVLAWVSHSAPGNSFTEYAPVDEEQELDEGYSCNSVNRNIGLMREGEERLEYAPNVCGKIKCQEGIISYTMCGDHTLDRGCYSVKGTSRTLFPQCCSSVRCP